MRAKVFARTPTPKRIRLQSRDFDVLAALNRHWFLSAEQLRALVLRCDPSTVRRRLRSLFDYALVDRLAVVVPGVPSCVYTLTKQGGYLLRERGVELQPIRQPAHHTLRHRYLVNSVFVALTEGTRQPIRLGTTEVAIALSAWRHERELLVPGNDNLPQPEYLTHPNWRDQETNELIPLPFQPDAYFELTLTDGRRFAFFLELDRATQALAVWRQRVFTYAAANNGPFQRRFGRETFRCLVISSFSIIGWRAGSRPRQGRGRLALVSGKGDVTWWPRLARRYA